MRGETDPELLLRAEDAHILARAFRRRSVERHGLAVAVGERKLGDGKHGEEPERGLEDLPRPAHLFGRHLDRQGAGRTFACYRSNGGIARTLTARRPPKNLSLIYCR